MSLYFHPKTLEEAVSILAQHGGTILSGGTDFFPSLGDRAATGTIVDISSVLGMKGIVSTPEEHRIGGLSTWTEVIASSLPSSFDALKSAAREVGGIQIQNRGTVAGNLCNASPAADSVPPLLALEAEVELVSTSGMRRMLLSQFILGNRRTARRRDEILSAVLVPRTLDDAQSVFLKLGARRYLVISIAMVAVVLKTDDQHRITDARIAVGSCSATAQRLTALERGLVGVSAEAGIGKVICSEHMSGLSPIDDVRASAEYRKDSAQILVARALEELARRR